MADAGRTTTTLDLRVNARELNRLDRSLKETLGPRRARDFGRSMERVDRQMSTLVRTVESLTREFGKQRNAGRQYKDMARDLSAARQEAEKLRREMEKLRGGTGGGLSGAAVGGFGGGGGGGYRPGGAPGYGGSWATPQVGTPDASSISTALGAIPFLGLAAAGGTMASFQMYGSALRHQTAKRDTFAYLGPQGAAMHNLRRTSRGQSGRYTTATGGPVDQLAAHERGVNTAAPEFMRSIGDATLGTLTAGADRLTGGVLGLHGRYRTKMDAAIERDRKALNGEIPVGMGTRIGRAYTRAALAMGNATGAREAGNAMVANAAGVQYRSGHGATYNTRMGVDGLSAVGVRHGLASPQAMQEASTLSRAMGTRTQAGTYDFARSAQTAWGVGLGQSGDIMKSGRLGMGMGQQGGTEVVARLIGAAVSRGLEGSEISDYLSGIQGILKTQMESGQTAQGIEGILALQRRLNQTSGMSGYIAGKMGVSLAQGASQIGHGGGNEAMRFEMLRGMGWDGSMQGYSKTMLEMQDPNRAAGGVASVINSIRRRTAGMDPDTRAYLMQQAIGNIPGMKGKMGADTARKLAMMGIGKGEDDTITNADVMGAMEQARGHAVGLLSGEAGMENQRITQGYRSATQVQALNQAMISLAAAAQNVLGPALDHITEKMASLMDQVDQTSGSGVGGG